MMFFNTHFCEKICMVLIAIIYVSLSRKIGVCYSLVSEMYLALNAVHGHQVAPYF